MRGRPTGEAEPLQGSLGEFDSLTAYYYEPMMIVSGIVYEPSAFCVGCGSGAPG